MKSWAEMDAAGRGGVVAVVGAVIAALFYGAWTVSRPPPVDEAVVTSTGTQVEPEPVAEPVPAAAEPIADAAPSAPSEAVVDAGETEPAAEEAAETAEAAVPPLDAAEEPAEPAQVPAEAADAAADATPAEAETIAEALPPSPPVFDLVRVEQDGSALVAGSALAGATVSLKVTGAELAAVPTDGQGKFVAMFNLAPSVAPRVLSMSMTLPDGSVVPAEATVVIGPTIAPLAMAKAVQETTEVAETEAPVAEAPIAEGATAEVATAEEAPAPVAEATAPAALLVTEDGARVLQSAGDFVPELVANVTIDAITYTESGAVQLAGRGTAERVVRLYLDNSQVAETPIGTAGDWAVTLSDVAAGIYTLRADQVDATGKVTSRFETPFKRETVEALASVADATAAVAVTETATGTAEAAGTEVVESGADGAAAVSTADDLAPALTVTVQPGFTLWRIATENLGEGIRYVQVFEANKDQIRDPDLIYPGQVFTIPVAQ